MADRIKIHIVETGQDTTGEIELHSVIGTIDSMVAIMKNVHNLKRFQMFSKVKFMGIEEDFYCSSENELVSYDSKPFSYWTRKIENESEDNSMLHKVTITKSEEKALEEYWCIRAVKENIITNAKSVIGEMKCTKEPTLNEIAIFLGNSGADFVSVEHNFRFEPDIPFC